MRILLNLKISIEAMIVYEWKGVNKYLQDKYGFDVPVMTLKRWHRRYLQIPFAKTVDSQTGRVYTFASSLDFWFQNFVENFPYLYNVQRNYKLK